MILMTIISTTTIITWAINCMAILTGISIVSVWLMRYGISPNVNGQRARSMSEELTLYGLPEWSFFPISFLEILSSVLLIVGILYRPLMLAGAILLATLMCGAVAMHVKVKNRPEKALPAITLLAFCLLMIRLITQS